MLPDVSQVAIVNRLPPDEPVHQVLVSRVAELDHDVIDNRGERGMPDQQSKEVGLFREPVGLPQGNQRRLGERSQYPGHRIDRARLARAGCHWLKLLGASPFTTHRARVSGDSTLGVATEYNRCRLAAGRAAGHPAHGRTADARGTPPQSVQSGSSVSPTSAGRGVTPLPSAFMTNRPGAENTMCSPSGDHAGVCASWCVSLRTAEPWGRITYTSVCRGPG